MFALYPDLAPKHWIKFLKIFVMTFAAASILTTKVRIHGLVWILAVSIGAHTVLAGITGAISVGSITASGPPNSPYPSENLFARACIMIVPLMIYLGHFSSFKWVRYGAWFGALASISALVATGSRGGFIGFGAMLIYAWITSPNKIRNLAVFGVLGVMGLAIMNADRVDTWTERMITIGDASEQETAQQRFDSWRYGFDLALADPLTGGGFGAFRENFVNVGKRSIKLEAHSNYFQVLGEHGFVGLFLYLALALASFRVSLRIEEIARERPDLLWAAGLSRAIRFSLVGYFVGGLTVSMAYFELYYVLLGLLGGLLTYCSHHVRDDDSDSRLMRG